jgi:hypothetical protein
VASWGFTVHRLGTTDPSRVSFSSGLDDMFGEDVGIRYFVLGLVIESDIQALLSARSVYILNQNLVSAKKEIEGMCSYCG